MVLTYMACGCMTIRMRMHELQEKRERNKPQGVSKAPPAGTVSFN